MNLLMKGAALAPPFSCTTKYSSDVYSPRPPDIRVRLLPTKPPVHFTTEQPGRDTHSANCSKDISPTWYLTIVFCAGHAICCRPRAFWRFPVRRRSASGICSATAGRAAASYPLSGGRYGGPSASSLGWIRALTGR